MTGMRLWVAGGLFEAVSHVRADDESENTGILNFVQNDSQEQATEKQKQIPPLRYGMTTTMRCTT
jgi:hypothetical protein